MIGEVAEKAGVTTATINFYVKEGLVPAPRKLNRTRAAYSEHHLRVIRLIKRLQNAVGMPLSQIKRTMDIMGCDDEGLAKAEAIGSLQPLPAVWGDAPDNVIDHFDPMDRDAFVAHCRVEERLVDDLLRRGILRPRVAGRFDANDAWLVRTVAAFLDEGIALESLDYNRELVPYLREMAKVIDHLLVRHAPALQKRELRFRDLLAPLNLMLQYLLTRVHEEDNPNWREMLYPPEVTRG